MVLGNLVLYVEESGGREQGLRLMGGWVGCRAGLYLRWLAMYSEVFSHSLVGLHYLLLGITHDSIHNLHSETHVFQGPRWISGLNIVSFSSFTCPNCFGHQ